MMEEVGETSSSKARMNISSLGFAATRRAPESRMACSACYCSSPRTALFIVPGARRASDYKMEGMERVAPMHDLLIS